VTEDEAHADLEAQDSNVEIGDQAQQLIKQARAALQLKGASRAK
jgi:hypothetical protein